MHRYLIALLFLLVFSHPVFAQKDFSLSLSPQNQTLNAGRQTTFTVTAQPINGFRKPVNLTVTTSPSSPDVTATLSNTTINPGSSATITVTTSALANAQNVSILVTGVGKNKTRTASGSLAINVPQFNLTVTPPNIIVLQGDPINFTITTQGEQDFARPVSLSVLTTPNIPTQLSKQTLSAPSDSATLQFPATTTPIGAYNVLVIATAGQIQRTASVALSVMPRPGGGNTPQALVQLVPGSVVSRANNQGKLQVTGLVRNNGTADAAFVRVTLRVFDKTNNNLETDSTFINGFSAITSTGVFTQTTLAQGRSASFNRTFDLPFLSEALRVEIGIDFMTDSLTNARANLVIDRLTRSLNSLRGSDFSVVVRNSGTVAARAPQIIVESFNRADQVFDVTIAGVGDLSDTVAAGQTRTFNFTNNETDFDITRVNTQHAVWVDGTTATTIVSQPIEGLFGKDLEDKRNETFEMQRLTHLLRLELNK
ncbi:MAG: hypothetical protein HY819_00885 [Acidobacteria bacterium]|nr:hypothetical protein [Acidobacteriota bacterium]